MNDGARDRRAAGHRRDASRADVVVSNADSAWTYRHLLAPEHRAALDRPPHRARALFDEPVRLVLRHAPPVPRRRAPHDPARPALPRAARRHLRPQAAGRRLQPLPAPARPPPIPSLAPPGCDAFYVLSPVPHLQSGTDWATRGRAVPAGDPAAACRRRCCPAWPTQIVTSRLLTPQDFQDRLSSFRGAAFGLEPVLTQSAWFRPHNRSEEVDRLYLVGAGTHPGAGLPGVLSSARVLDTVVPHADALAHPLAQPDRGRRSTSRPTSRPAARRCATARAPSSPRRSCCRARVREPACALYAFCRLADDAVDERRAAPRRRRSAARAPRARLRRHARRDACRPTARSPRVVARYAHSARAARGAARRLRLGRRRAAATRRSTTLHAYAARVAGTVGAMMTLLMGARSPTALARACDLGVAMQLTNIARDVGEDARDRPPLPAARTGCARPASTPTRGWPRRPSRPALGGVVQRLLRRRRRAVPARRRRHRAACRWRCRPGINAARFLYAEIGREVRAARLRFGQRARRRAGLAQAGRCWRALLARACRCAAGAGVAAAAGQRASWSMRCSRRRRAVPRLARAGAGVGERVVWVIELFERLERRERAQAGCAADRRAPDAWAAMSSGC